MSENAPPPLTRAQKLWPLMAALLFLCAIGFLGFALNTGVMRVFAIGWVLLQLFGFGGALKIAKGDTGHPLFASQVMLHGIALVLLIVVIMRIH